MSSSHLDILAPLAVSLPEGPSAGDYFSEAQWATLMAIMDTVIPSVRRESSTDHELGRLTITDVRCNTAADHIRRNVVDAPDMESLDEYLNERPSDNPEFEDLLKRMLVFYVRDDARKGLTFVLSTLNTRLGSLMLTGSATPFHQQPILARQAILENWRQSYLTPLQAAYKQLTFLAKNIWLKTSPNLPRVTGFSRVPDHYKPGPHYEYEFLQFTSASEPQVIETDVVIVGSGCGGAVCAKNLAEAGHRVVVVDKSYYYAPKHFPMDEASGGIHLFENGGIESTDDASMSIIVGSNWGGGGTINWSASLQPQAYVRKEWAQDRGLKFFESAEFQKCLDRVCDRMGVSSDHIRHNHGNEVILEGSRKLGYTAKAVPQNTGGEEHYCGYCTLGCGSGQKQGPVISWLPDAAKSGAEFIEGFKVERVLFNEKDQKKAIGIKGLWTSRNSEGGVDGPLSGRTTREVIVKAKKVIISCGTLWSPIVLMNSGLKNSQIGRNTYLHPVNIVTGIFKDDVKPWEGGILTSVCSTFENLDGHGHGVKLEATCMLPSYSLTFMDWKNGFDFKMQALKYRHMNSFISIARDRDTGRIYKDSNSGVPRIAYTPSAFDRANIMEGVLALAKLCYVSGATEIHAGIMGMKPFIRNRDVVAPGTSLKSGEDFDPGVSDPRFANWLAELKRIGNKPPTGLFACAHQMGSNRMSARARDGVVDPTGRVWGTENLYVSDASVFPSASGVNPMVTNMAISDWISRGVSKELRKRGGAGEGTATARL